MQGARINLMLDDGHTFIVWVYPEDNQISVHGRLPTMALFRAKDYVGDMGTAAAIITALMTSETARKEFFNVA